MQRTSAIRPARSIVLLGLLLLAGCAGQADSTTSATEAADTPEPAAFDLALVKSNFIDECRDPIVVDDLFCEQVRIKRMTADGTILIVPTTLNALADDRAAAICDQIAIAHFDGASGEPLGFDTIGVLDQDGGNAAACSIRE